MYDPSKLAVEMWAEKRDGRVYVKLKVEGEHVMELLSWPQGFDQKRVRLGGDAEAGNLQRGLHGLARRLKNQKY